MAHSVSSTRPRDAGDIVVAWLGRLVVILAIVAAIGYDGVQVGLAKVSIQDQASTAAQAGRDSWQTRHSVENAYTAAVLSAHSGNTANVISPKNFVVSPTGVVTLTMTRPIHTLFAHYLPTDVTRIAQATASASPGS
jgi:hypothetical protein